MCFMDDTYRLVGLQWFMVSAAHEGSEEVESQELEELEVSSSVATMGSEAS